MSEELKGEVPPDVLERMRKDYQEGKYNSQTDRLPLREMVDSSIESGQTEQGRIMQILPHKPVSDPVSDLPSGKEEKGLIKIVRKALNMFKGAGK